MSGFADIAVPAFDEVLRIHVAERPEAIALRFEAAVWTCRQIDTAATRIVRTRLRDRLVRGNRVTCARRPMRAGIPVERHVYPGACYAFRLAPGAAVSRRSERDPVEAMRRAFA